MSLRLSVAWEINFTPRAAKAFRKLDKAAQRRVSSTLREIAELEDPRSRGKPLVANRVGLWRWRVGNFRVIADIHDQQVIIVVIDVGHRSSIYG
ncbi:type II toxin-antitoxin system RelE family toxin [Corynebacterium gottingense]|uniref:type II toxin-antitoxin system RelE family toxin n=1 Tax=Corynebacterium gottingense TaxID=2041036 RepID=UPI0038D0D541